MTSDYPPYAFKVTYLDAQLGDMFVLLIGIAALELSVIVAPGLEHTRPVIGHRDALEKIRPRSLTNDRINGIDPDKQFIGEAIGIVPVDADEDRDIVSFVDV